MNKKPWQFNALSLIYFCIGISIPIQVMVLYHHNFSELDLVFQKLTVLNKVLVGMCFVNAIFCFRASRFVFLVIPLSVTVAIVNNYYVSLYSQDFIPGVTYIASLGFLLLPSTLLLPSPLTILTTPSKKWWRHEKRLNVRIPIEILRDKIQTITSVDVSASGLFLECGMNTFPDGAQVQVVVPISTKNKLSLHAKVVRKSDSKGSYPEGVGIEFTKVDWKQKLALKHFLYKAS